MNIVPAVASSTLGKAVFGFFFVFSDTFVVMAPSLFFVPWSIAMMADIEALRRCVSPTRKQSTSAISSSSSSSSMANENETNDTPLLSAAQPSSNTRTTSTTTTTTTPPIDERAFAACLVQIEKTAALGGRSMPPFVVAQLAAFGFNFITMVFAAYSSEKTTFNGWNNVLVVSLWSLTPILSALFTMAYVNTQLASIVPHIGYTQRNALLRRDTIAVAAAQRCNVFLVNTTTF
jgi:hypothetical protein